MDHIILYGPFNRPHDIDNLKLVTIFGYWLLNFDAADIIKMLQLDANVS